jgi:hypothetical protein
MRAMLRSLRPYLITLLVVWVGLAAAAMVYTGRFPARSHWIMVGVLPAFLFEAPCFIAAGFEQTRQVLSSITRPWQLSLLLIATSLPPYLLITTTAGTFDSHAFYILVALVALISFWWVIFPHRTAYEAGFLIVASIPIVLRIFQRLYVSPEAHFDISILGHVMWIRVALIALLVQRDFKLGPVSFWPTLREWREGLLQFAIAIIPLSIASVLVHFAQFAPKHIPAWQWVVYSAGQFFGILWVVAFSEDVFRSTITQLFLRFSQWWPLAIVGSAVLFGTTHLWQGDFPNWRFATVAALGHLFYTIAYLRSGSVRASMITHALTVTAWRMFFRT